MNKKEMLEAISAKTDFNKKDSSAALEAVIEIVGEALAKGDKVALLGFGTFSVADRLERKGRNPQTGAEMTIPAKKVVKFKVGSALNDKVN